MSKRTSAGRNGKEPPQNGSSPKKYNKRVKQVNNHNANGILLGVASSPVAVVGGFSLRLPESDSAEEFWQNLINGKDMVSDTPRNWDPKSLGLPTGYGKLRSYDKFDNQFFEVHPKQTEKLDPQIRLLLEVAYEAMLDACFNPKELNGSNTGVFIGACGSDIMSNNANNLDKMTGYENTGCALSMFANRISYHFNLKGPSMCVDTACSSSLTAFDLAYKAILNGDCDHALVGGANFVFHPLWSVGFNKLNMISDRCKSFNQDGNGFARAEGAVVIMLSREGLARKKYARVLTSQTSCDGYTKEGITFPDAPSHRALLHRVYKNPLQLQQLYYMETHGTGTVAGDPVELNSIEGVLFDELGRKGPVHIGSVKSNMGHSEAASGLAGFVKVLLSMLHSKIPANLHAYNFNKNIPGLSNGHLHVVSEHLPFEQGLASVSSFGFGGSNAHVLLEKIPAPTLPRAPFYPVPFSARTEDGFGLLSGQISRNYEHASSLLTRLNRLPLAKNPYRGFMVMDNQGTEVARVQSNSATERPVWLVLNGVGAQWSRMGTALMQLPYAKDVLTRCHQHLSKHRIDLVELLSSDATSSTPVTIFVSITCIQIALYECVKVLDIPIAGYFGHSLGELVCAYIDGAVTFEQTLDIAYFRGLALVESEISGGSMVAVDLDLDTLRKELPGDLEIACFNGKDNYTIAGPEASVKAFSAHLTKMEVPNKVLDTGGIPFHSSYIAKAKGLFKKYLGKLLRKPKHRSAKWISSSRDPNNPSDDVVDMNFFIQNLFEPVQFVRCMQQVPAGSFLLELGPHGLFKGQFAANLPQCEYTMLMKRKDLTLGTFWKGMGALTCAGVPITWSGLFPDLSVEFPLTRIETLVSWDHTATWPLPEINLGKSAAKSDYIEDFSIDVATPEWAWVKDHIVNGNPIFPGMGYLHLVWLTLAKYSKCEPDTVSVELQDIRFVRASIFRNATAIKLTVKYDTVEKSFQVLEGDQLVARGTVSSIGLVNMVDEAEGFSQEWTANDHSQAMQRNEVYKLFVKTGIEYRNSFRGIASVSADRTRALVDWIDHWTPFFDSVLQLFLVGESTDGFGLPKSIDSFRLDPSKLPASRLNVPAMIHRASASIHTPCLDIEGLRTTPFVAAVEDYVMCAIDFQPYVQMSAFEPDTQAYFDLCRALVLDNLHRIIHREDLSSFSNIEHLQKIQSGLGPLSPHPYSQTIVDEMSKNPKAHLLRFLAHVFSNWRDLLVDAMPVILSSPDHKQQYREDLVCWKNRQVLENLLELVVRNSPNSAVIRVVEVGAGTGSMTSMALPYMFKYMTEYTATDISSGFFAGLKTEFAQFEAKAKYMAWDANNPLEPPNHYDLIMGSNSVHTVRHLGNTLEHIARALKDGGFFLVHEFAGNFWYPVGVWGFIREYWDVEDPRTIGMHVDEEGWAQFGRKAGLELVMLHRIGEMQTYILFRKIPSVAADSLRTIELPDITARDNFLHLQSTLDNMAPGTRVWLVGKESVVPGLDGFVRTLSVEIGHLNVRGLLLADGSQPPSQQEIGRLQQLDMISNVWKNGKMGTYFRTNWENIPKNGKQPVFSAGAGTCRADNYQVCVTVPGDLSSTKLVAVDPSFLIKTMATVDGFAPVVAKVFYFSLNFKDAMLASGRISSNNAKAVFGEPIGMEFSGVLEDGTRVMGMREMGVSGLVRIDKARDIWVVPQGMSLQEACTIPVAYATAATAIVFKARATRGQSIFIHSGAGAVGQAAICISLLLGLDVYTTVSSDQKKDFLCSRFPGLKREQVLDTRTTFFKNAIMERTGGKGVDIILNSFSGEKLAKSLDVVAKYGHFVDISRYDAFHNNTLPMRAFLKNINYSSFFLDELFKDGHRDAELVHSWVQQALDSKQIIPLHLSESSDVVESLQRLLKGNSIGKIVIDLAGCQAKLKKLNVVMCNGLKSYIVTGGLGGIGLELLEWLVSRGAKDIIIITRSPTLNPHQQLITDGLKARGVKVEVSNVDMMQEVAAMAFFSRLESQGRPVGGVFHLAMVLKDRILANLSYEDFLMPVAVKIGIGRNLDVATRRYCPQLEHFVMFSSVLSFYGNMGQSNYALGNSSLERMVEKRNQDSLAGVAIQVGAVGDVGFLSAEGRGDMVSRLGMEPMKSTSFIDSLDHLLLGYCPVVSSHAALRFKISTASTNREKNLVGDVLAIMGFQTVPAIELHTKSLVELGVDSLMVVEINQVLSRDYNIRLSPKQIRQLTLEKISEMSNPDGTKASTTASTKPVPAVSMCLSIYDPVPPERYQRAYYYIDGIFLDPSANLPRIEKSAQQAIYFYIPYHNGILTLESLIKNFLKHVASLPPSTIVTICGFSFGSVIAGILGARGKQVRPELVVKGFAIPRTFIDILDKLLPLIQESCPEHAERIQTNSDAISFLTKENLNGGKLNEDLKARIMTATRRVFGDYEDGHMVSYEHMLCELNFLELNRAELLSGGTFDEVYAFQDDPLSMPKSQSAGFSKKVFEVQKKHSPISVTFN